jgi:hypothetical protein
MWSEAEPSQLLKSRFNGLLASISQNIQLILQHTNNLFAVELA